MLLFFKREGVEVAKATYHYPSGSFIHLMLHLPFQGNCVLSIVYSSSSTTVLAQDIKPLSSYLHSSADADGPAPLELPNQWLWDIIDEFIYQVYDYKTGPFCSGIASIKCYIYFSSLPSL